MVVVASVDIAATAEGRILVARLIRACSARYALRCGVLIGIDHPYFARGASSHVCHGRQVRPVFTTCADSIEEWCWFLNDILASCTAIPSAACFPITKVSSTALASVAAVSSVHACCSTIVVAVMNVCNARIPKVTEPTSKYTIRRAYVIADGLKPKQAGVHARLLSDTLANRSRVRQPGALRTLVWLTSCTSK